MELIYDTLNTKGVNKMNMYQRLRNEKVRALKEKDSVAKRLIPYVLSMANTKDGLVGGSAGAEPSDAAIFDSINKTISANKDLLENKECANLRAEIAFLETLLPDVMGEVELRKVMSELQFETIGDAMKQLSQQYPGKFEKPMASKIAREML